MVEKFYVTTAIDYVNAEPHIGHGYQKIVADVLARWNKVIGKDVFFVTGTDEHGKKIALSAENAGKNPKDFVNEVSEKFKEAWKSLNIDYDRFIRTTDEDHREVVDEIVKRCNESGDIYKGEYKGYYCVGCEAYITEKDLVNGECSLHPGKKVEEISEETYFFRLSQYQEFLLSYFERNPNFILPAERRKEVINRVKEGLRDLSITRSNFDWGIPFALDKEHVLYVWFEALINYYTATRKKGFEEFWGNPTVHLLGKDNTWFHTVIWPAICQSAGIKIPGKTLNHGFLTFNGQKISKSLGNSINPKILVEKYGADAVRYFVCRHFPFASGGDGDFSESALIDRHNNELANKLGNLVSRVTGLIEKKGFERCDNDLAGYLHLEDIKELMSKFEIDKALNEIFAFIDRCNEYVQEKKPWETGNKKVLYELADSIKKIAILLWPFIPATCEKIAEKLGGFEFELKGLGESISGDSKIIKGENLFNKIDSPINPVESPGYPQEKLNGKSKTNPKVNKNENPVGTITMEEIVQFGDWEKLDLRVAQIKSAEAIEGADKLWKITLDVGDLGERIICAGLKEFYSAEELIGKKISYFSNLASRKMKGIESQGMLLAASSADHKKVVLLCPEEDIENGSRIG